MEVYKEDVSEDIGLLSPHLICSNFASRSRLELLSRVELIYQILVKFFGHSILIMIY